MSFPKELDSLVRGGGELSCILACILAEKKDKVLLVDEGKEEQRDQCMRLTFFEKRFLQELGKKNANIDTLINIERCLTSLDVATLAEGRIVSLNSGPHQNILEFKRKFPLSSIPVFISTFDNTFFEVLESFVQCWLKEQGSKSVFQIFLKENKNKLDGAKELGDELRRLLPSIEFFLKNPFDSQAESELYSITTALSFFGPHYSYQSSKLCHDLRIELETKGGFFKQTGIEEIRVEKKESVVELESFEGLVYPKSIFTESHFLLPPLKKTGRFFSSWEVSLDLELPLSWDLLLLPQQELQGGHILYAELARTSEGVLWRAYFEQPELAIDSHIAVFLEKTLKESLKALPFAGKFIRTGNFLRRSEEFILYQGLHSKPWKDKRGLFSSLLRLRDVIMSP